MAKAKPLGFDNWKTFSFVSSDGSGLSFFRKASFGVTDGGFHKLFAGPSIVAVEDVAGIEALVTTAEAHGYAAGQAVYIHGVPNNPTGGAVSALVGDKVITEIVSTTQFKVLADTSTEPARPVVVTAGALVAGETYTILTLGTTDFTLIGAASNTVGLEFVASGTGSGTGTAHRSAEIPVGVVGVDIGAGIDSTKYSMIPGDFCINDHPEAWEMPLVG